MDAEVTVLPVPGGPWISPRGRCNTVRMACIWELFSFGKLGAESLYRVERVTERKGEYNEGKQSTVGLS